jgi:RimJ/RimL family protein N-acetyltransferase/predicted GNAT family acetyltransferase
VAPTLLTERLALRMWHEEDASPALAAYGDPEVARWLAPAIGQVPDEAAMRLLLRQWTTEDARLLTPAGRWAIELRADGRVIGGATLLPLLPDDEYEVGWQLSPPEWGHGYGTEAGLALVRWAFDQGLEQVIALVRPANARAAAMVRRMGMEWVGETEKYHELRLQEYRLRPGDLTGPHLAEAAAPVTDNAAAARFEVWVDGHLAELLYRQDGQRLVLIHTEVPAALDGHGLGGRLVMAAVDRAARDGLTIVPLCPFARAWLARHPDVAGRTRIDWDAR